MSDTLTSFGKELAIVSSERNANFETGVKARLQDYQQNKQIIACLRDKINAAPGILILGAGKQNNLESILCQAENWFKIGVHWTNFNPLISADCIASTHVAPLESVLHSSSKTQYLLHGVYSKVPPLLLQSMTLRWSDPFLTKGIKENSIPNQIDEIMNIHQHGLAPYIPAPRNTLFFAAMSAIWLGAKRIAFTAVDPCNPGYFFGENTDIMLEIVTCLNKCDPWLAEWDGRNERLGKIKRDTSHRIQTFTSNILSKVSAVGQPSYLYEFDRAFKLIQELALIKGVKLGYLGYSEYMKSTGLKRLI